MQNSLKGLRIDKIPQERLNAVLKEFKKPDLDSLLIDIAIGNILTVIVAKKLSNDEENNLEGAPITGTSGLPYTFAQCCLPIPGDDIIGHITPGKGLVIHNTHCNNIADEHIDDATKFLPVYWDYSNTANMDFETGIRIELKNRQGILSEISNAVDVTGSKIEGINSDIKDDNTYIINLTITVRDRIHLASIIKRIKTIPNILKISRRK